jgi:hypothetical protein
MMRYAREAITDWRLAAEGSNEEQTAAVRLVHAFETLDRHLSGGGQLPADWDVSPG